ncbi:MAG TPA: ATP-binding protein, partial [bacterium]|nr:ATP-binding protein [bacterium]
EYEQEFLRSDGTMLPVSVRMWLLRDEHGEAAGTWGIARDITERKAAENRIQVALAEMERSNRELEQFAYVASHDLQEPLTVIAGYAGLLAHRYQHALDDKARRYIELTVESVQRMQAMIQGLLQYSRIGHGDQPPERVPLTELFAEMQKNLAAAIDRTGAVVSAGDLPVLKVRRFEILRLLQNLVENALKYRAPDRAPVVRVSARRLADAWEIAVADNGQGIPPQHRERIFQIFQRLHTGAEYQGTGIGLAISKKVVEKYGGSFRVEDNPGGGSVFNFTLATRIVEEEQNDAR